MSVIDRITLTDGSTASLHRESLPPGDEGVFKTLAIIERFVLRDAKDPRVVEIARAHKRRSERATAKALFDYMVANHRYVADPEDREHFTAPVYHLTGRAPFAYKDCDDLAGAMAALLTAAGIRNALKVIAWRKTDPPGQFTHVYNVADLDGVWTPMDLVMREKGFANEKRPIIRSAEWIIGRGRSQSQIDTSRGLADEFVYPDINWEAIGKDILTRALPKPVGNGENVGEVLRQHMVAICVTSVKQQLLANKGKLLLAGTVAAAGFTTIGFVAAVVTQRLRRPTHASSDATKRGGKK
ncbi:MAG: hypothetical protein FGM24_09220 [Candidatus Kapabacteria bacterium]|nr:hypothetical protein [Candidatus Kapabacteria bacterium]